MKQKHRILYRSILSNYEDLSTCARLKVVALLVKDGTIMSVGYNGVAHNDTHCNEIFKIINGKHFIRNSYLNSNMDNDYTEVSEEQWYKKHHEFSEENEIHAETNCLMFALKNNIDIADCSLILSVSPCIHCSKMIVASGIKDVYYINEYDRCNTGTDFLIKHNVICEKL